MNKIRAFRKANGLSQSQLADYLQVGRSFIAQIETGRCNMPDDKFHMLVTNTNGWNTEPLFAEPSGSDGDAPLRVADLLAGTAGGDFSRAKEPDSKVKYTPSREIRDNQTVKFRNPFAGLVSEDDFRSVCEENTQLRIQNSQLRKQIFALLEKLGASADGCDGDSKTEGGR